MVLGDGNYNSFLAVVIIPGHLNNFLLQVDKLYETTANTFDWRMQTIVNL